ncbi:MATE family efflux transporter [Faecalicatena orotica]|uniref:Putative MATE family efflux protein n=1 Tax=Faecalicatena orotica TaxID=1544 RepID=A0A2Y9BJE3_9FIRM|nr:MATE family efflux transporter [Faecalicatena orotica]PWJ23380.1 putative MATE family efflux protein [Faecalicatena orotica]SSA57638.1 putative efflux protein, MATE family [Faecalicatena orotica]
MNLRKEFFRCVIPSMFAFALSGVYAIADGFFVGNALGDSALAAINVAYPLTAFLQAAGTGLGMGGAVEYAISLGTNDHTRGRQYFGMSLIMLVLSSIILTLIYLPAAPAILQFFGASGDIQVLAEEYVLYITYGAVFQILGTGIVPFIRNMGSSIAAMLAMTAGFFTNIILDYLFVWKYPLGMTGAAAATVCGQAVTFLVCLICLFIKKEVPLFHFQGHKVSFVKNILKVGLSPFGLTFSPNITLILINKSAALTGGTLAVTYYAPVSYISCIVLLLLQGVSDGCQPLLSLSYGEGNVQKTKQFRNMAYRFGLLTALFSFIVLFFAGRNVAELFGASGTIAGNAARILPVFLLGYLFVSISRITTAYFYATGKNMWAYILIYGEVFFLFVLLLFLPKIAGISGTWFSVPASQLFAMMLSLLIINRQPEPYKHVTARAD